MAIQVPHFHDGSLDGIALGDKSATIILRESTGEKHNLMLSGLEVLQMEGFRDDNIISMVVVVSGQSSFEHSTLERLFQPPHPTAAQKYHSAHTEVLRKQSARIAAGEIFLVMIIPSYGADLVAICRDVSLTSQSTDDS